MGKEQNYADLNIGGIQCDNSQCDFVDMSVRFEDYPNWVNKPCEKCGENLLTEEAYDSCLQMLQIVNMVNSLSHEDLELFAGEKIDFDKLTGDKKIVQSLSVDKDGKVNLREIH